MPRIPNFEEARNMFPETPMSTDVGVERFGRDAAVLANLGGEIGDFGSKLISARKQAMEADYVMKAHQDDIRARAQEEEVARQEFTIMNADGTVSFNDQGFAERMKKWADNRIKTNYENAPTGDAQQSYMSRSGQMFANAYNQDLAWENMERAKGYLKNYDQEMNAGIIQVGETPSIFNLSQTLVSAGEWLNKSSVAPVNGAQKAELYKAKAKEMIYAYFDGLSKTKDGAQAGLDMLSSLAAAGGPAVTAWKEDGTIQTHDFNKSGDNSYLYNFLTQKDVQFIRDDLMKKNRARSSVELNGLKGDLKNVIDRMSSGQVDRQAILNSRSYIERMKGHITEDGPFTMREWQEVAVLADVARVSGEFIREAADMPTYDKSKADANIEAYIERSMDDAGIPKEKRAEWSFAVRQQFEKRRELLWRELVKERNSDPVAYMMKHNIAGFEGSPVGAPSGKMPSSGSIEAMLQEQRRLGVARPRLLSNAAAKSIADQIESSENPNQAAQALLSINGMGKYSKQYMNELVKNGNLDEKYRAVTMLENQDYSRVAIESFKQKGVSSILSDMGMKEKEQSLQAEVNKQYDSYFKAISRAGDYAKNINLAQSIKDVVAFDARQRIAKGMNVSEAVETSMSKLVKQSFDVRHGTLVPRQIGGQTIDPRKIEGEMNLRLRKEWQEKNVRPFNIPNDPNANDRLWKALGSAQWNVNETQTGARLEVYDKVNKTWVPVYQKNGEPVFVDYVDAETNTSNNGLRLAPEE